MDIDVNVEKYIYGYMYMQPMYIALTSCFILPLFHATVSRSSSCLIPHPLSLECTLKSIHIFICICVFHVHSPRFRVFLFTPPRAAVVNRPSSYLIPHPLSLESSSFSRFPFLSSFLSGRTPDLATQDPRPSRNPMQRRQQSEGASINEVFIFVLFVLCRLYMTCALYWLPHYHLCDGYSHSAPQRMI